MTAGRRTEGAARTSGCPGRRTACATPPARPAPTATWPPRYGAWMAPARRRRARATDARRLAGFARRGLGLRGAGARPAGHHFKRAGRLPPAQKCAATLKGLGRRGAGTASRAAHRAHAGVGKMCGRAGATIFAESPAPATATAARLTVLALRFRVPFSGQSAAAFARRAFKVAITLHGLSPRARRSIQIFLSI